MQTVSGQSSTGKGAYFTGIEVDSILSKLYQGEAMKEKLSLTTRALGEAESLVETHEKTIKNQKSIIRLKEDQLTTTKDYWNEYHKEYKTNARKATFKKVVIAFVVGLTIGILAGGF